MKDPVSGKILGFELVFLRIVDDLSANEETEIIKTEKALINLYPDSSDYTIWGMGGPQGVSLASHHFVRELKLTSQFAKRPLNAHEADYGDIEDLLTPVQALNLTLTSKNLVFSYLKRKGWAETKKLVMNLPMAYAKSAVEHKRNPFGSRLDIEFEVLADEVLTKGKRLLKFKIVLRHLNNRQEWLSKLRQVIAEHSTQLN